MNLPDLAFIDVARPLEVEAVEGGRGTAEFTFAPDAGGLRADVSEDNEASLHGRPADDIQEMIERKASLARWVPFAEKAFEHRGLRYPFSIDASGGSLEVAAGMTTLAVASARLAESVGFGNPVASQFEKRAFRALHKLLGGWGVCVGSPRVEKNLGAEKTIRKYRALLLAHEQGGHWPEEFSTNGDNGADGLLILGRGWGGPVVFYQSKNSKFELKGHAEEFARIPAITQDWFGRRVNLHRRVIPVVALNTVLTLEAKERIYEERGESGVHILDAVDILAAEYADVNHVTMKPDCQVF